MRRRVPALLLAACAALAPAAAGAMPRPELAFAAGTSFGSDGRPAGGGASLAASAAWAFESRFGFGVRAWADDAGTQIADLRDPNDGSDLGSVATAHRWTWGASWLAQAELAERGPWRALADATWGVARHQADVNGASLDVATGVDLSAGLAALRRVGPGGALGASVRMRHVFLDRGPGNARTSNWATAALEWRWLAPRD